MMNQATTAGIAIAFVVMYQICMKVIAQNLNPVSALVTFYVTALVCTLVGARFLPVSMPAWSYTEFSWAAAGVGVAIVGIELGFLLMYRTGWHLSTAPMVVMGGAAVLLIPVAWLVFQQPWSARYFFGLVLCLSGLYLLAPQKL